MQTGLLAIDRRSFFRRITAKVRLEQRRPRAYSVETALERYRGIEGDLWPENGPVWPSDSVLAPTDAMDRLAVSPGLEADTELLFVAMPVLPAGLLPPRNFLELGFDLGCLESKWSHYSIVLNEVLFGLDPALRGCAELLNENFLAPSIAVTGEIIRIRQGAIERDADLEELDMVTPIQLFGQRTKVAEASSG